MEFNTIESIERGLWTAINKLFSGSFVHLQDDDDDDDLKETKRLLNWVVKRDTILKVNSLLCCWYAERREVF